MRKYIFYVLIIIAFGTAIYFLINSTQRVQAKCPTDYADTDSGTTEYRKALIDWTTKFFKANPNATISDWSIAKLKLWEDNNCVIALERSKLSGNVSNLKPWELVDYEVQNSLDKTINKTN